MARKIYKQRNGKYAIWSTIADGYIETDMTRKEIIEFFVQESQREITDRVMREIDRIENHGNPDLPEPPEEARKWISVNRMDIKNRENYAA